MLHIRLISVLLKLLENLDKWPRLENSVCGAVHRAVCVHRLCWPPINLPAVLQCLSYVQQLQGALHCLQSARPSPVYSA